MSNKNIKISIIIVHYNVEKELIDCISSILKSRPQKICEIIVIDNDEEPKVGNVLNKKFKDIKYIKSPKNLGYGGGNNLGASYSQGDFLFFLNPDTIVKKNAIDRLVEFLENNKNVGIVAPIFLDPRNKIYPSQGSEELTPLSAIFSLSFINKVMPNNPISKRYFLSDWNKKKPRKVGNVPGTAFLIRKNLFEKVGKFDENFFLYFEEFDFCKRVRKLGYDLFFLPSAQIIHLWGVSTGKSPLDINKIFLKSKFYYFRKHYGLFWAVLVQLITGFSKIHLFLLLAIILAAFLRLYKLEELMSFIGDQGWFYLSARDMLLTGNVPLVGIPSSHPWIHQGPLWTYILGIALWIGNFHPVSGAYLTAFLGIVTVFLVYKIGLLMFSRSVGLIAMVLYATSPLVVVSSRMAYHTSPIPLFTILFIWSVFKWIKGTPIHFPLAIFFLGILYSFELATSILWLFLGLVLGYGLWKRKFWAGQILTKKIIMLSVLGLLVSMMPIIIYDFQSGFPQTLKFVAWVGYKILGVFGIINSGTSFGDKSLEMISFFANQYRFLIFSQNGLAAFLIFILTIGWTLKSISKSIKSKKFAAGKIILVLWILLPLAAFFVNKTPSDAYIPLLFPAIILVTAFSFELIMRTKIFRPLAIVVIGFIVTVNIYTLLSNKYFSVPTFKERIIVAEKIIKYADGKKYDMVGKGIGSEFESFTMNYEYLTWWLGHGPVKNTEDLKIFVSESSNGIKIEKINN